MRWLALVCLLVVGSPVPSAVADLELSTDHRALFFGLMQPGEEKMLAEAGTFHNEIACASTGGSTWYVKISILQPLSSGMDEIPLESFGWQLTRTDGSGSVVTTGELRSFTLTPDLVYISGPGEGSGQPVHFQFRYSLKIPEEQMGGVYHTTIRFTFTEVL